MNNMHNTSLLSITITGVLLLISTTNSGMENKNDKDNAKVVIENIEDLFLMRKSKQKNDDYRHAMEQYRADGVNPQSWSNANGPVKKKIKT